MRRGWVHHAIYLVLVILLVGGVSAGTIDIDVLPDSYTCDDGNATCNSYTNVAANAVYLPAGLTATLVDATGFEGWGVASVAGYSNTNWGTSRSTQELFRKLAFAGSAHTWGTLNAPWYSVSSNVIGVLPSGAISLAGTTYYICVIHMYAAGGHYYDVWYRIGGTPPPPEAGFNATPTSGTNPLTVTFVDTSTVYNTTPSVSYVWSFGDGTIAATRNATHTYTAAGQYNATLTVTDGNGISDLAAQTITVSDFSTYTLTASPDPVGVGGTITITATSSAAGWGNVVAYVLSGLPSGNATYGDVPYVNGYPAFWYKKSGTWYQFDGEDYTISWGSSFPATVTTSCSQPGTYTIEGRFWEVGDSGGGGSTATDTITVTGEGAYVPVAFRIIDGSSGSQIVGSQINIKQVGTSNWTNTTAGSGTYTHYVLTNVWYTYTASATGYEESDPVSAWWDRAASVTIRLTEALPVGEGNRTLWVSVNSNEDKKSLTGATVRLSDGQAKTTGSSGVVHFTVEDGATYKVTASKTGYNGQTWTGAVDAANDYITFYLSAQDNQDDDNDGIPNDEDDDDDNDGISDEDEDPGTSTTPDVRTNWEKDADLMDQLRDAGPGLVGLAILATMMGLLKLIFWK